MPLVSARRAPIRQRRPPQHASAITPDHEEPLGDIALPPSMLALPASRAAPDPTP
jgi:hypothetical protein